MTKAKEILDRHALRFKPGADNGGTSKFYLALKALLAEWLCSEEDEFSWENPETPINRAILTHVIQYVAAKWAEETATKEDIDPAVLRQYLIDNGWTQLEQPTNKQILIKHVYKATNNPAVIFAPDTPDDFAGVAYDEAKARREARTAVNTLADIELDIIRGLANES